MPLESFNFAFEADKTLARLIPRLEAEAEATEALNPLAPADTFPAFERRLRGQWPRLFRLLLQLYGDHYDFFYHLEQLLLTALRSWLERPEALKTLDHRRENDPTWYQSQRMCGGALYVDLFSENLGKLREHIPYFRDLGLTYLHLMPLFAVREGESDGGYAISNYRSVNPDLGTIDDLRALTHDLREVGISPVLDFVFNHTADDHYWAKQAQAGDPMYQEFYYIFPDRTIPDQYERTLREIFPTVRRGNFTWHDGMRRWVWTTFNSYQWDLNYANPEVLTAMLGEMLFLANTGVEILRLDAVAFIWKEMGTNCENRPEAHTLIQIYNALSRIAAPSLIFKSEAIVHPDEVVKYVSTDECQVSYNPTLMALMWEALATRSVKLLTRSLSHRHSLPEGCSWCNYLRCHDDIGWSFDNDDAWAVGIDPHQHRAFLNRFYTGEFPGSFARGVPFQHNPETGDMRIAGTMASLAGLEQAVEVGNELYKEMALRRIEMLYGTICAVGGLPLIYLGEEWGIFNDYDYIKDPAKAADSRWIHRPRMRWEFLEELKDQNSVRTRLFITVQELLQRRKEVVAFAGNDTEVMPTHNDHVLGIIRRHQGSRAIVLANFSEQLQYLDGTPLRATGIGHHYTDLLADTEIATHTPIVMDPYRVRWLVPA